MTTHTAVEVENLVRAARDDARKEGIAAERARVFRCRNAAFRGVRMAVSQLEALGKLDGMLLRGEDPGGPAITLRDFDATTLRAEVAEASAALTALGHTEDGRTLAERIADARAESMAHLHAARAAVAERDAQIARLAQESDATEAALRAQITALTSELAEARGLADGAGAACLAWEEKVRSGELVHRDTIRELCAKVRAACNDPANRAMGDVERLLNEVSAPC